MEKKDNFSPDKPITRKIEDKFQRSGFAERIAEIISNRIGSDSLTIGISAAWGEGKTSVLNLIKESLQGTFNLECLEFNPWRYQNEDLLLKNFFLSIATQLGFTINQPKEKIGGAVKKWGAITKVIKIDLPGGTSMSLDLSELGKSLTDVDIEIFKKRVNKQLTKTGTKLVVFLDDLDRLDKEEIFAVFRLVKLTADFSNTTYILSFDEELVANAIAERYPSKSGDSGKLFLEKIIQIPLRLPTIQPYALNQFCYEMMQDSFHANNIKLTQRETDRFGLQFTTNILPRLTNPRLAVRYNNAISFALPLLQNEANIVDLLILESIKIFYAPYYDFIKTNPNLLVEGFASKMTLLGSNFDTRSKQTLEKVTTVMPDLSEPEKKLIQDLLSELFPILKSVFYRSNVTSEAYYKLWYKEKRICTTQYFERYFSYTVYKGQISDIDFEDFIDKLEQFSTAELAILIKELIHDASARRLTEKLRFIEDTLSWEKSKKIIEAICTVPESFIEDKNLQEISFTKGIDQAAILIYQLYRKSKEAEDAFVHCKNTFATIPELPFMMNLYRWITHEENVTDRIFNADQNKALAQLIVQKALLLAGEKSIYEALKPERYYVSAYWKEINKKELFDYTKSFIGEQKTQLIAFLKLFVQQISHSGHPEPFLTNMTKNDYAFLQMISDTSDIYQMILKYFPENELLSDPVFWLDNHGDENAFSEINMIRQFITLHQENKMQTIPE